MRYSPNGLNWAVHIRRAEGCDMWYVILGWAIVFVILWRVSVRWSRDYLRKHDYEPPTTRK